MQAATFTEESCRVADLITSCSGGRNARCAKLAIERNVSIDEVERTELNGQMLPGTTTAREVHSFLKSKGREQEYPLSTAAYRESILIQFRAQEMLIEYRYIGGICSSRELSPI